MYFEPRPADLARLVKRRAAMPGLGLVKNGMTFGLLLMSMVWLGLSSKTTWSGLGHTLS